MLKDKVANYVLLEVTSLPYNRHLIDWLKEERGSDKRIVLSYTTDKCVAESVAYYFQLFDEVISVAEATKI